MELAEMSNSISVALAKHMSDAQNKKREELLLSIKFYNERLDKWTVNEPIPKIYKKSIEEYWGLLLPNINVTFGVEKYGAVSGYFDVDYIHDGLFYSIIDPFFNYTSFATQFDNKAYYPLLFRDIKQPHTIALRLNGCWLDSDYKLLSFKDVLDTCVRERNVVIKFCRYTSGGNGIIFKNNVNLIELEQLLKSTNVDIVIQEIVKQHPQLSRLHSTSVNTIRIMTLLWNNEVIVLSSVLRMGINGACVDNASFGGIVCGIENDGKLKSIAYDKNGNKYYCHPQGMRFNEVIIPNFKSTEQLAIKLQARFPYCKMISWDIAIDKNGEPLLIEANLSRGELDFHQFCNGAIFGTLTKDIITLIAKSIL
ncbi:MAG: hypothetical protein LBM93_02905 [Oscillospiraceae bacterium]|jgi:hypothetical protein|nr:hypothetical protein [Oscillospiraceae bacterium]